MRLHWQRLHLIVALIAALPLLVASFTGSLLVFMKPIDRLLNEGHTLVAPTTARWDLDRLVASVHAAHGDLKLSGVTFPRAEDRAFQFWGMNGEGAWIAVYVDPYRGRITEVVNSEEFSRANFIRWMTDLHASLRAGDIGATIVGWSALLLCISCTSGLVLGFPRNRHVLRLRLRPRLWPRWRQNAFHWHNLFGFYLAVPLLLLAITGATMAFPDLSHPLIFAITGSEEEKKIQRPALQEGEAMMSLDSLYKAAVQAANRGRVRVPWSDFMRFPTRERPVAEVFFQTSEELYHASKTALSVDARTAEVLVLSRPEDRNAGQQAIDWVVALHFGSWGERFGILPFSRGIWLILSLSLPFFLLSGLTLWRKPSWLRF